MIPKEMKYNLHYGDVREDALPPPHGTNTSCSVLNKPLLRIYKKNTTFSFFVIRMLELARDYVIVNGLELFFIVLWHPANNPHYPIALIMNVKSGQN